MFDALSDRLRATLANLTGRGRVSEADVDVAMREVRLALLEADVNFKVVKDFVARVRERAIGARHPRKPHRRPAGREDRQRRARPRSSRPATGRSTSRATRPIIAARRPPGLGQDDDRGQARPPHRQAWAAGRCSSRPTRTGPPPPTSSRRSARRSTCPVHRAPVGTSRRRHRAGRRSRPPAGWSATSSSSTRPAGCSIDEALMARDRRLAAAI